MTSRWIEHNGAKILFTDFSDCDNESKLIGTLEESAKMYQQSEEKILGLFDMQNTVITENYMKRSKELAEKIFNLKRKKSAVVGVTGIKTVLLQSYNQHTSDALKPFATKEEALLYLTS